jgi:hypothetical protein
LDRLLTKTIALVHFVPFNTSNTASVSIAQTVRIKGHTKSRDQSVPRNTTKAPLEVTVQCAESGSETLTLKQKETRITHQTHRFLCTYNIPAPWYSHLNTDSQHQIKVFAHWADSLLSVTSALVQQEVLSTLCTCKNAIKC